MKIMYGVFLKSRIEDWYSREKENVTFLVRRFKRLGSEFVWIVIGQSAAALGGIVGVRLLTGVLSPESYGNLALGMTIAILAQQVLLSPLAQASLRFFSPALEANQLYTYLRGVRYLLLQATIVWLVLASGFGVFLWKFGKTKWLYLVLTASLFSLFSGYSATLNNIQNAARQRPVVALHQGAGQWLRFLTAVFLVVLLGAYSTIAMLGYALSTLVILSSQLMFFRRKILVMGRDRKQIKTSNIEKWMRQMRSYAWPFSLWGVFTWAQLASDRWALQTFSTINDVGLYMVLYQLGYYPISLLSGFLGQLVAPILFSRAGDGSDPIRLNQSRHLNILLVLGTFLLSLFGAMISLFFHAKIFSLLVAPEYHKVSSFLPLMVLSGGLFACGQIAVLSLLSAANSQVLILPKIFTALLAALLNFFGAYWLGLRGVVFAGLIFSLIYLGWVSYLIKQAGKNLEYL